MSNTKLTISLNKANKELYKELKGGQSSNELIGYLMSLASLRIETRGATKVELKLLELLHKGNDKKITPVELQVWTNSNLNICKSVFEHYKNEIEIFNKRFN